MRSRPRRHDGEMHAHRPHAAARDEALARQDDRLLHVEARIVRAQLRERRRRRAARPPTPARRRARCRSSRSIHGLMRRDRRARSRAAGRANRPRCCWWRTRRRPHRGAALQNFSRQRCVTVAASCAAGKLRRLGAVAHAAARGLRRSHRRAASRRTRRGSRPRSAAAAPASVTGPNQISAASGANDQSG